MFCASLRVEAAATLLADTGCSGVIEGANSPCTKRVSLAIAPASGGYADCPDHCRRAQLGWSVGLLVELGPDEKMFHVPKHDRAKTCSDARDHTIACRFVDAVSAKTF